MGPRQKCTGHSAGWKQVPRRSFERSDKLRGVLRTAQTNVAQSFKLYSPKIFLH